MKQKNQFLSLWLISLLFFNYFLNNYVTFSLSIFYKISVNQTTFRNL